MKQMKTWKKEKKLKRLPVLTVCLLITALFASPLPNVYASDQGGKIFTKHFQKSLFDITGHALYSVEVLPNNKEYDIGQNTIGVIVHNDKDEDVKGAELSITYKNVDSGKTISPAKIEDKHNGLYIVSGLDNLFQPGRWDLGVTVNKDGVKDSVEFNLPEAFQKLYPKGRYSP
ncbi:MAG: hypothetical protein M0Z61_01625 [Nitrospiraceae bacterium]|nr:hypothetical protein [Nitrospiraceae bacterium]